MKIIEERETRARAPGSGQTVANLADYRCSETSTSDAMTRQ